MLPPSQEIINKIHPIFGLTGWVIITNKKFKFAAQIFQIVLKMRAWLT